MVGRRCASGEVDRDDDRAGGLAGSGAAGPPDRLGDVDGGVTRIAEHDGVDRWHVDPLAEKTGRAQHHPVDGLRAGLEVGGGFEVGEAT